MISKNLIYGALLLSIFFSCNAFDDEISIDTEFRLSFDQDTVFFDTIFTNVGSITKRLKVYNAGNKTVIIDDISLGNEISSPYKMIINGLDSYNFQSQKLLAGDSLLVLISLKIDPDDENLPFLVKDSISFLTNNNRQYVKLVGWGQNAHFLKGLVPCNMVWTSEKPYVLYDTILIDAGCFLKIKEGSRIYLDYNTSIFVRGSLQIEGTKDERVLIRNSRLDKPYENAPGQWGGIYFLEGSKENYIDYAVIRNGQIGIRAGTPDNDTIPDIVIGNTIIENMSVAGILAYSSDILAYNTLIHNCGQYLVANLAGGSYYYDHCTFANYFPFRENNSVVFNNTIYLEDNSPLSEDLSLHLTNTIIWGNHHSGEEIQLAASDMSGFAIYHTHNLLKTKHGFFDSQNSILNKDPNFLSPNNGDFRLREGSPALNKGLRGDLKFDLNGNQRGEEPSIGAYEYEETDITNSKLIPKL